MSRNIQSYGNDYEKIGFLPEKNGQELFLRSPQSLGQGFLQVISLRPGLKLLIRDFQPLKDIRVSFEEDSLPLVFSFLLSGAIHNDLHQGAWKRQFLFAAGQICLTSFPAVRGHCIHPAGKHMQMINIWISRNMLKVLLKGTVRGQKELDILLSKIFERRMFFGSVCPAIQTALVDIVNCPFHGAIRRLFLESKCTELICYQLAQITADQVPKRAAGILSAGEVERIHHARDLLLRDLQHPPSVDELAKRVGTNDYTLRQGFRKVFGTTIFEQLRQQRLVQAKILLERSDLSVAEVAFQVGYSDIKHFYQKFKQQFHTTPGSFRT